MFSSSPSFSLSLSRKKGKKQKIKTPARQDSRGPRRKGGKKRKKKVKNAGNAKAESRYYKTTTKTKPACERGTKNRKARNENEKRDKELDKSKKSPSLSLSLSRSLFRTSPPFPSFSLLVPRLPSTHTQTQTHTPPPSQLLTTPSLNTPAHVLIHTHYTHVGPTCPHVSAPSA
jgi:hypothetical protein